MRGTLLRCAVIILLCGLPGSDEAGGVPSLAVRDVAEVLLRKLGRAAAHETAQTLAVRLQRLVLRYGDDVLVAARRVGPESLGLIEGAGELAPQAVRLLAHQGEDALRIVAQPRQLALVARHGDEAAAVLLRHQDAAVPLLEAHAKPALEALRTLTPQNGRRLAMLQHAGDLQQIGRTDELLAVIARHGDRAMEFVWNNKGSLAVAAVLARFLADPEPFLAGIKSLSTVVVDATVRPVAEIPQQVAEHAAQSVNWNVFLLSTLAVAVGYLWLHFVVVPNARRR